MSSMALGKNFYVQQLLGLPLFIISPCQGTQKSFKIADLQFAIQEDCTPITLK